MRKTIITILLTFAITFIMIIKSMQVVSIIQNPLNYTIVTIRLFNNDFNYIYEVKGVQSIND